MFAGTPVCWGFCSHLVLILCGERFYGTTFFSVENLGNMWKHMKLEILLVLDIHVYTKCGYTFDTLHIIIFNCNDVHPDVRHFHSWVLWYLCSIFPSLLEFDGNLQHQFFVWWQLVKDFERQNRLRLDPLHKLCYDGRMNLPGEKHETVTPE